LDGGAFHVGEGYEVTLDGVECTGTISEIAPAGNQFALTLKAAKEEFTTMPR
jgi:hypothetical protein